MDFGIVIKRELSFEWVGLLMAIGLGVAFVVLAPAVGGPRAWLSLAYSLLLPVLIAGRTARRFNEGWLFAASCHPGYRKVRLLDWAVNLIHCLLYAAAVSHFDGRGFMCAMAWSLLVLGLFDLCEYRGVLSAPAWSRFASLMALFIFAPMGLGFWFNSTDLSPYIASYSAALHPALCLMTSWSLPHLQDAVVYRGTLWSGSWVMPISWRFGAGIYFVLAVVLFGWFVLRPTHPAARKRIET